jgi:hypothetical protein
MPDEGGAGMTDQEPDREAQWRKLVLDADSMLSLIRHRGNIRWGGPLPDSYEVDSVIGRLRRAYEKG